MPREFTDPARGAAFPPLVPKYVSAPETVRRYLGQGSKNRLLHWVGNALIRWRPDVHRRDYHSPVLDSAVACMPCHSLGALDFLPELPQKTYRSWETSRYSTDRPETTVTCQDCHMARVLTAQKTHEVAALVPWGPAREGHHSHLFIGGNRTVPELLHDPEFALLEHKLNLEVATVALVAARRGEGTHDVEVRVETRNLGHDLPSMGAQNRWLWVEVVAKDAQGQDLVASKPPKGGDDAESESPVIFRCMNRPAPACDTTIGPDAGRVFRARLKLEAKAPIATVQASLHLSVDPEPIAVAARGFPF
jgi:hypothetical protein